mmetsp:Transcript_70115/g.195003  ORF Transcript_70115/g.195003 Transcript_70115/m.195003 type:complete len:202 (+) Transcript_70115:709-1314(+)
MKSVALRLARPVCRLRTSHAPNANRFQRPWAGGKSVHSGQTPPIARMRAQCGPHMSTAIDARQLRARLEFKPCAGNASAALSGPSLRRSRTRRCAAPVWKTRNMTKSGGRLMRTWPVSEAGRATTICTLERCSAPRLTMRLRTTRQALRREPRSTRVSQPYPLCPLLPPVPPGACKAQWRQQSRCVPPLMLARSHIPSTRS